MISFKLKQILNKRLQGLLLGMLFVLPGQTGTVSASRSIFSGVTAFAPVTSFAAAHPRLTKVATVVAAMSGALWALDRIRLRLRGKIFLFDERNASHDSLQVDGKRETAFIFAHGLGGDEGVFFDYNDLLPVTHEDDVVFKENGSVISRENHTCSAPRFETYSFCSALGQEGDITCLARHYARWTGKENGGYNKNIVLCGVSRGASVILNFMARGQLAAVKALVLESPFDTLETVIDNFLGRWALIPGLSWLSKHFFIRFGLPFYNPQDVQPINVVNSIQKDVPILFVCSKRDKLVPWNATARLYKKLREQGRNNVHILICEKGSHANILANKDSGVRYRNVTHAFYRHYGLWYEKNCADAGEQDFVTHCQPDPATLLF